MCVPAGVVQVQVRVDHHVHVLRVNSCGSQIREEARVQVRERGQRPVLPVAGPSLETPGPRVSCGTVACSPVSSKMSPGDAVRQSAMPDGETFAGLGKL